MRNRDAPSSSFQSILQARTRELYDMPVRFWKELLGDGLHFHLGHFSHSNMSLSESASLAVRNLVAHVPHTSVARVLDVGCGWGGPAFMLAELWKAEVFGLTVSRRQAQFVNREAQRTGAAVRAQLADIEHSRLHGLGAFDVCWLFEVLEHTIDRRGTLQRLHRIRTVDGSLALTVTCRAPTLSKDVAYSEYLGIAPLESIADIHSLVRDAGWKTVYSMDCTHMTLPIWDLWIENLRRMSRPEWQATKDGLIAEFTGLGHMFRAGLLQSLQLVAVPQCTAALTHN